MLDILYLCDKNTYDTKMSRVRFHGMRAVGKRKDVNLVWSGPGWKGYNKNKSVSKNVDNLYKGKKPDLVVAYKPLNLVKIRDLDIPNVFVIMKCMTSIGPTKKYLIVDRI